MTGRGFGLEHVVAEPCVWRTRSLQLARSQGGRGQAWRVQLLAHCLDADGLDEPDLG